MRYLFYLKLKYSKILLILLAFIEIISYDKEFHSLHKPEIVLIVKKVFIPNQLNALETILIRCNEFTDNIFIY